MSVDDVAGDRQAEPGPTGLSPDPGSIHLVEALKDPRECRRRDADPMVGHGADHPTLYDRHGHADVTAVRTELHGVMEKVDEHLGESRRVAANNRQLVGDLDPQADALAIGEQAQAFGRFEREPADVDEVDQLDRPAAFDA